MKPSSNGPTWGVHPIVDQNVQHHAELPMTKKSIPKSRVPRKSEVNSGVAQKLSRAKAKCSSKFLEMPEIQAMPNAASNVLSHEAIAERAYLYHEKHGACHGRDIDDWLAAEASLLAERESQPD